MSNLKKVDHYSRALRLLGQRERSRQDMAQRFTDLPVEECEALLNRLESEGYLSDQRVAEALWRRAAQRHGVLRLCRDFQHHGIAAELAQPLMDQARQEELESARHVRSKKFPQWPQTPSERAKQARYLHYRGFSDETVHHVLDERGETA